MRAAIALTKDAPPLTEAERLERIQRWTKSAAENRHGESRDLISDLRKIKTTLDPKDHITSRMVVNEFEKFIASKRSTSSDKKVQFLSARAENRSNVEQAPPEDVGQQQEPKLKQNIKIPPRPRTSVDVSGQSKQHQPAVTSRKYSKPAKTPTNNQKSVALTQDESKTEQQIDNQDPAWWHRKIRQGYLETEEMISKLETQRKIEEKQLGVKAPPITRMPEYMSRKFPHTSHERRRLDRSMERLRKKHEACFGKPVTASELDAMSGHGATEQQQKKRKGAISRVSGLHVPVPTHVATREPIPLPKTMTSHLEDNWTPPKYPRSASKINKESADSKQEASKSKNEIKVLYEREKNAKEYASPERANPRKNNSMRREWVQRLYEAQAKKAVKDAEKEKERSLHEKDNMNALYKELIMNKRRLSKYEEDDRKGWRGGKRVPSWRLKQFLAAGGGSHSQYGSRDGGSSYSSKTREKKGALLSKEKWNERPPKGLGMWLEGVIAKAKRQQDLARGIPGPVTEALMRPLTSFQF